MARPTKEGLDYFSLDVDIDQDDKVMLIEAAHGMAGFGLVIKILMKIYKEGYYYHWTEREQLLFSKKVNVDVNEVNVVINDCLRWGFFDCDLYDKYQILTSKGIQKRFFEAIKRRDSVKLIQEFVLINPAEIFKKPFTYINVAKTEVNETKTLVNVASSTQRKEKKRKAVDNNINVNGNSGKCSPESDETDFAAADFEKEWPKVQRLWESLSGRFASGEDIKPLLRAAKGDANLVVSVIEEKYRSYKPRSPGMKINSIGYFLQPIIEAMEVKESSKGKTDGYDSLIESTKRALGMG